MNIFQHSQLIFMPFLFVKQPKLLKKLATKTLQCIKNTTASFVMLKNVLLWRMIYVVEKALIPNKAKFLWSKYYKNITIVKYFKM